MALRAAHHPRTECSTQYPALAQRVQLAQPSGLLDWEALSELQQNRFALARSSFHRRRSSASKLIETVQEGLQLVRLPPLLVDAETGWPTGGAAQAILNIFLTPAHRATTRSSRETCTTRSSMKC